MHRKLRRLFDASQPKSDTRCVLENGTLAGYSNRIRGKHNMRMKPAKVRSHNILISHTKRWKGDYMKAVKNNVIGFLAGMAPIALPVVMIILAGAVSPLFGIR